MQSHRDKRPYDCPDGGLSYHLLDILNLNGTDNGTQPAVLPPSPMSESFRPSVSIWINVIWPINLTLGLMCTFFGWCLSRLLSLQLTSHRFARSTSLSITGHRGTRRVPAVSASAMVALLRFFLPLSVFLSYFGLIVFLIHIDVTTGLAFVSLLVVAGFLYVLFYS